jgi:hypothetical protein
MVVDAPLSGLGVIISGNELAVRIRPIGCLTEVFQRASFFKWHRFIVDEMVSAVALAALFFSEVAPAPARCFRASGMRLLPGVGPPEHRNASEPPVFGELSTGYRNHLAWAPTAGRNDAVSRPRNVV